MLYVLAASLLPLSLFCCLDFLTGQNRVSLADGVVFARLTAGGVCCYMGLDSASFFLLEPWVYISLAFTWVSCTKKY